MKRQFFITLTGGGIIEAETLAEALEIMKKCAGCYVVPVLSHTYECDDQGLPLDKTARVS